MERHNKIYFKKIQELKRNALILKRSYYSITSSVTSKKVKLLFIYILSVSFFVFLWLVDCDGELLEYPTVPESYAAYRLVETVINHLNGNLHRGLLTHHTTVLL